MLEKRKKYMSLATEIDDPYEEWAHLSKRSKSVQLLHYDRKYPFLKYILYILLSFYLRYLVEYLIYFVMAHVGGVQITTC